MVLEGQNAGYEVIQTLPETGGNLHYRCRRQGGEELCHLAGAPLGADIISYVVLWQENPAFADLKDYLIWEDRIYLVTPDLTGSALKDVLETMTPLQRFSAGQQVMEHFLIQDLPLCLQWELACPEAVYVGADGTGLQFLYLLESVTEYAKVTKEMAAGRLYGLFEALFSEKIRQDYPETSAFLAQIKEKTDADLMSVYAEYLSLLPALSRVKEEESEEKEPLIDRLKKFWKKWSKILLSGLKVALGVMTLCAALILLPQVWKEKISPVIDGMFLWKQVYVDGEPLPSVNEPVPTEENDGEETGGESGAGRKTLYWENGEIRYQGGMLDDQYEGTGTLYYADGTVEYQGSFSFGKREGEGVVYTESGLLLYEGQFGNDRYEGEGRLYDGENGSLLYEGGFQSGRYSGEGTLYQPLSDFPLYVGGFRLGHYDGKGLQYDENGCMLYEGDFLLGVYHGNGTIYDPQTGAVLFTGAFRNGMPVLTEDLAEGDMSMLPGDEAGGELSVLPGDETGGDMSMLPGGDQVGGDMSMLPGGDAAPAGGGMQPAADGSGKEGQTGEKEPPEEPDGSASPEAEETDGKSPVIGPVGGGGVSSDNGPGVR